MAFRRLTGAITTRKYIYIYLCSRCHTTIRVRRRPLLTKEYVCGQEKTTVGERRANDSAAVIVPNFAQGSREIRPDGQTVNKSAVKEDERVEPAL